MEGLEDHRHCRVCGKSCPPDREVCSKTCRATREERTRSRQTYTYLMYGLIAFFFLLLVVQLLHL